MYKLFTLHVEKKRFASTIYHSEYLPAQNFSSNFVSFTEGMHNAKQSNQHQHPRRQRQERC